LKVEKLLFEDSVQKVWGLLGEHSLHHSSATKGGSLSKKNKEGLKRPTKSNPLIRTSEFIRFRKQLSAAKRVLVSTHAHPDGDGIGAEAALFHYLKAAGKSVRIYNPDPLPSRYRFLDPKATYLHGPDEGKRWDTFDLWIIVDTNDPRRLGKLWSELAVRAKNIVFLDHHPDTLRPDGDTLESFPYPEHASVVCDILSSSIGELLYALFQELKIAKINPGVALGLYVSVMTDTNSFRYARTTPEAHRIAAEMIALGVNPEEVYQTIFSSKELSHLRLLGEILTQTQVTKSQKVAWMEIPLARRKIHKATADDTMSFLNLLLLLKSAEVVCLFREEDDKETVRVSMRSKGRVVINRIAMELGGGGHDYAAGLALRAPMEQVVKTVTSRLESLARKK
jgi:bifunctional oligoribonuclease and PAP phosphatase NrnA